MAQVAEVKVVAAIKEEALVAVLRSELKVTPDKSLQGGPRTARRAVHLLVSLGRSIEARDLLLVHRWDLDSHIVRRHIIIYVTGEHFLGTLSRTAGWRDLLACTSRGWGRHSFIR